MNNYFNNKIVAITGGSDGIGKAMVELLLTHGAKISTCARNQEKLHAIKANHSEESLFCIVADVSKQEDCVLFIQSTIAKFGGIDILINNAGVSMRSEFINTDVQVIKKVMDINFFGTVYCTKEALRSIIERKGSIVGISSIAGYRGLPGRSGYSASKFALNGWLESLRTELLHLGVNVMWVCPGFTKSNIRNAALNEKAIAQGESPLDENSLMKAEVCAQHILHSIEKRKRTLVLTFKGKQTIFMNKIFPAWADRLVRNFFYKNEQLIK